MSLIAALSIEVGGSIAKSLLKNWLKDSDIASDASATIMDILKSKTADRLTQKKAERQFEMIGEKVGENLLPLFESEGAGLVESSRVAVALAVAETLNSINSQILATLNLEPSKLAAHLLIMHNARSYHFNEEETFLYQRIISESCEYIVDISSQLPKFTQDTFTEVLKRESLLLAKVEEVLQEVNQMRAQLNPKTVLEQEGARFELEYLRAIVRNLDIVELFGTDVAVTSRRHRLSIAYVALSVERKPSNMNQQNIDAVDHTTLLEEVSRDIVTVDSALADSRCMLIRGPAGSGKTTLLQWIAVNAALKSFSGHLEGWNKLRPFYIRLRGCIQSGLPAPEDFPKFISIAMTNTMPNGWVHTALKSGQAIVLVDGLDELPEVQRREVRVWLKDLVEIYPEVHFIVTSRPHAVEEGWMDSESFKDAELQPMELSDIYAFINHWHAAVSEGIRHEDERNELLTFAEQLKVEIRYNRAKRNLATSPLLCAMLCALNRERRQQLPSDRIELYNACSQMLIERRDRERRIQLIDYPAHALTYRQKRVLLEDLAYWLLKNGWSEIELLRANEHFTRKLATMQAIPQGLLGSDVQRLFIERTGIVREPVTGRLDFTHRTFQEFLAAQAILDEGDIGVIVQNAHNHQWREVIILSAGLATKWVREEIIQEIIRRGDAEKEYLYPLHLLAVSCLEASVELGQNVKILVQQRLQALVPPKNMMDAKALAAAGDLAIPYLVNNKQFPAPTIAACIWTLTLIGSDLALDALEEYSYHINSMVAEELFKAWDSFDTEIYAQNVLSHALKGNFTVPKHYTSLIGFQYFTQLTSLNLSDCENISDLSPLASLTQLTSLNLARCTRISDLSPLARLTQLTSLDLTRCTRISDLSPLARLTQLTSLDLTRCMQISDLSPLARLTQLTSLDLTRCMQISDLSPLARLTQLTSLSLSGLGLIDNLSPLESLAQLNILDLSGCTQISDIIHLAKLNQLKLLNLNGCGQISEFAPLANLTQLDSLYLSGCDLISDLTSLADLVQLTLLHLKGCRQISDLAPLIGLNILHELNLAGCGQIADVTPLANLTQLVLLDLSDCRHVSDLTPLIHLSILQNLYLGSTSRKIAIPLGMKKRTTIHHKVGYAFKKGSIQPYDA
jgi:Leucine-rich repeat (LRR) protein